MGRRIAKTHELLAMPKGEGAMKQLNDTIALELVREQCGDEIEMHLRQRIRELEKWLTCPYCKEILVTPYGFGPEGYGFKCLECGVEWKDESNV